jgi:hypothetical protein
MCLTRIRSKLSGRRGSLLGIVAVMLIGLVVFVAHSEPSAHDMEGDGAGMSVGMSICLAVLQVAVGVLIVGDLIRTHRRRLRAPRMTGQVAACQFRRYFADPGHRIREGPSILQVFRH